MTIQAEEFKNLMSNLLLADPITTRGRGALTSLGLHITEEEYLNNLYVDPFTLYERELDEYPDFGIDPDYAYGYIQQVDMNTLKDVQISFENRLSKLEDSLFIIKGGAGSGKTTYVHHLQQAYSHLKFCFCDFEEASKAIALFGNPYDFGTKFNNNVWKFISIIILKIDRTLFEKKDWMDYSSHVEYLKNILDKYRNFFSDLNGEIPIVDEEGMWEFFECFEKYAEERETYSEFQKKLKKFITTKFDLFEKEKQHKEAVTYVCGILIRLLLCLNRISVDRGQERKHVCVIDNIESFIPFDEVHPIQECELQTIMNGVSDSASRIRPIIQKWKKKYTDYKTFFGFLLVTRDTSVSLAEYRHYDDYIRESEVDITTWFCLDDVYDKKIAYFREQIGSLEENTYYKAYRNILADVSPYNWGMYKFICQMYNNNYRRIGLDVVNTIVNQPESELKYFNSKWKYSQEHSECHEMKHLCRKFVLRILLDHIQRTKYFDYLLVEKKDATNRNKSALNINGKTSYARKVATILYRISLTEMNRVPDRFVVFPELVNAVLKPPYSADSPSEEQISDLGAVIYLMNETRNQYTNWAPLLMVKFDIEQAYNQENLKRELIRQWRLYESNGGDVTTEMHKYGVRIKSAGSFFAKMVPDFEYFACRFAPTYPALFVRENFQKNPSKKSYKCLEQIQIVKRNAFLCIDEVLSRDYNFFDSAGLGETGMDNSDRFAPLFNRDSLYKWIYTPTVNGTLIPHPWRILNSHIGYLSHYIEYISRLSDSELLVEDRNNIIEGVQKEIREYKAKLRSINVERKDYFNINR